MKIKTNLTAVPGNKIDTPFSDLEPQLSDNALYVIVLLTILKEKIFPANLNDYLTAGKFPSPKMN